MPRGGEREALIRGWRLFIPENMARDGNYSFPGGVTERDDGGWEVTEEALFKPSTSYSKALVSRITEHFAQTKDSVKLEFEIHLDYPTTLNLALVVVAED